MHGNQSLIEVALTHVSVSLLFLPQMNVDIEELIRLEAELEKSCGSATPYSVDRDAKVNMLKYLQIDTVSQFEAAYDALYYELNKQGGLECLRDIASARPDDLLQPKVLEPQDDEYAPLAEQLQFYLADAELAKERLDEIVTSVAEDTGGCEVRCTGVKSLESTQRKASNFCGGNVRKIADMARVTMICDTPEALKQAYLAIMGLLQVSRGYKYGFLNDQQFWKLCRMYKSAPRACSVV